VGSREEYDVAVSFADEDRPYVDQVVRVLRRRGVRVFTDDPMSVDMWGKDRVTELDDVYRHRSRFVLVFVSAAYVRDRWTRHGLRSAMARALEERSEYVLPARFDDTDVPGLPGTIRHVDCRLVTSRQVADMLCAKLGRAAPPDPEPGSDDRDRRGTGKGGPPATVHVTIDMSSSGNTFHGPTEIRGDVVAGGQHGTGTPATRRRPCPAERQECPDT
jgi:hypothetical protein